MKVKEFIKELETYNQEAEVDVIAHNQSCGFSICFGGLNDGEGTPKENTSCVSVYVDSLNSGETFNTKEK